MNTLILAAALLGQCPGCTCGPTCDCPFPGACTLQAGAVYVHPTLAKGQRAAQSRGVTLICFVGATRQAAPSVSGEAVYCRARGIDCRPGSGLLVGSRLGGPDETWTWYADRALVAPAAPVFYAPPVLFPAALPCAGPYCGPACGSCLRGGCCR